MLLKYYHFCPFTGWRHWQGYWGLGVKSHSPTYLHATAVICVNPINNWGNPQLLDYQAPSCDQDLQKFSRIL